MADRAPEIVLTDDQRITLVRLTKHVRVNRAFVFRARIVLACANASDTAVAERLRTTKTTVVKWRSQFVADAWPGRTTNRASTTARP